MFTARGVAPCGVLICCVVAACSRHDDVRNPADFASSGGALSACASGTTLPGLDVSSYQGTIDWSSVAGSGIRWAYARATEGTSIQDPTFPANWSGMQGQGVVRGAYHFFHPELDGKEQADYFLDYVGGLGAGDLPPMLDWEVSDNESGATASANGEAFVQEIQARTGKATVIYTAPGLWDGFGITGNFGGNPLWVANWLYCDTAGCCPSMPNGWSTWAFWQWSDSGNTSGNPSVPGVPARVDLDVFNGDEAQLTALAQGGGTTSADPCSGVPAAENGLYCGTSTENGFGGGNAETLYDCVNSVTQSTISCPDGCISEPPGMNDVCATSSSNPCGPVPASANGFYCGGDSENGFAGGNASTLYDCVNGGTASATVCPAGCTIEPAGTNDECTASSSNPCSPVPASANGLYCGNDSEGGFAGGDASTLYDCVNGSTVSTTACPNGCIVEPVGTNDQCASAANPCGPVPASANGLYCGNETENGFAGGNPDTLYDCVNGSTASTTACPNGCRIEPAGTNDACYSSNPCSPVPASANGLYCGNETENGFLGGTPDTLYDCVNGATTGTTACPNGCTIEPAGMNDACAGSTSNPCAPVPASANGLYCGDDTEWGFSGGAPKTLYDCVNGVTTSTTACPYGCIVEPMGTNDECNPSSNNPCAPVASSANGFYCGSETENGFGGGSANTLYDCVNGATASTASCPNGCTIEPAGTNDKCTAAPNDPCTEVPASADGLYCGGSTENGFSGGTAGTLYDCENGVTKSTISCPNGCTMEPPGTDDYCTPASSNNPCSAVPAADNGIYCGTSTENGFGGGDPNTLYDCANGTTTGTTHCASGCISEPPGMNDICDMPPPPSGPCAAVPSSGNGTYCGVSTANGFAGGNADTLYTCEDGATTATFPCAYGCDLSSSHTMDACAPAPPNPCADVPASDNGTYCGGSGENGFLGGDLNLLYTCDDGQTVAMMACPDGCTISSSGDMDTCATGGPPDAGSPLDGGAEDAGNAQDAGAGAPADAGSPAGTDAGPTFDAGPTSAADAGTTSDAGVLEAADAGETQDAGGAEADAGETVDAGPAASADAGSLLDAGASSGRDGGPPERVSPGGCRCSSGDELAPGLLALVALAGRRRPARRARRQ